MGIQFSKGIVQAMTLKKHPRQGGSKQSGSERLTRKRGGGKEEVELGQLRLVSVVKFNLTCDSNATNSYTQWQSRREEREEEGKRLLVSRQKPNSQPQYTQATLPGHKRLNENA